MARGMSRKLVRVHTIGEDGQALSRLAVCLLVASLLPLVAVPAGAEFFRAMHEGQLSFSFFEPPPIVAAQAPGLSWFVAIYPLVAAVLVLALACFTRGWVRGLGLLIVGAAMPAVVTFQSSFLVATSGLVNLVTRWDFAIVAALALAFVATRTQQYRPAYWLAGVSAAAGLLLAGWLLVSRAPSDCDAWLGFVTTQQVADVPLADAPLVRGILRNREFPQGTHFIWYVWWNLILLGWVTCAALCLLLPFLRRDRRAAVAGGSFSCLVMILIAQLLLSISSPMFHAHVQARQGLEPSGVLLLDVVHSVHWSFPPLLLLAVALMGISELLVSGLPPAEGKQQQPTEEKRQRTAEETQRAIEKERAWVQAHLQKKELAGQPDEAAKK